MDKNFKPIKVRSYEPEKKLKTAEAIALAVYTAFIAIASVTIYHYIFGG